MENWLWNDGLRWVFDCYGTRTKLWRSNCRMIRILWQQLSWWYLLTSCKTQHLLYRPSCQTHQRCWLRPQQQWPLGKLTKMPITTLMSNRKVERTAPTARAKIDALAISFSISTLSKRSSSHHANKYSNTTNSTNSSHISHINHKHKNCYVPNHVTTTTRTFSCTP